MFDLEGVTLEGVPWKGLPWKGCRLMGRKGRWLIDPDCNWVGVVSESVGNGVGGSVSASIFVKVK